MAGTVSRVLLLTAVVLTTAQLCRCAEYAGDGFSVEFFHRDSVKSPFHDPSLTAPERVLAAARRSTARAAALARSLAAAGSHDGAVSELIGDPFEYLMYVNVGTPPTRMLAVVETGIDLVWLSCTNDTAAHARPPSVRFNPSYSSTFGRLGCYSAACLALTNASCHDDGFSCKYDTYIHGSEDIGVLSTETFTFEDGCTGCRDRPQLLVENVNFACTESTYSSRSSGLVGLGDSSMSLVSQITAGTSLSRRFSYCLPPFSLPPFSAQSNASSTLNFGARAAVTEPGAVATPMAPSKGVGDAFYRILLEAVKIGNATFALPNKSKVILDAGTALTYLGKDLLDPMVEELKRRINLPTVVSPDHTPQLCYNVTGATLRSLFEKNVPDIRLQLAGSGGAVVTLKAENTFAEFSKGAMCLAVEPVTEKQPVAIIGNIAQQNMHVGYDLDKRTVTFATADCATRSYHSTSAAPV